MILRTRGEIARMLGISRQTLCRWLRPIRGRLDALGYDRYYVLPACILKEIYDFLGITEDDFK